MAMSRWEQLIRIKDRYREAHGNKPASSGEIADWAVAEGLYKLQPYAAQARLAAELGEALRIQYIDDGHGDRVRVNHSIPQAQGSLWDEIDTISRDNMKLSIASKRIGMAGEAKQIQRDLNYFNELHADEPPIQTSFNFNEDLADEGLIKPFSSELERLIAPSQRDPSG